MSGTLNIVSGIVQAAAGAALGAFTSWTGVGAVATGFLFVNGSATVSQGVGQIVNHVANSQVMREDNVVRTGVQKVGYSKGEFDMISIFCDKILDVTSDGMIFVSKKETLFINFPECANNFSSEHGTNSGMCVAIRDIATLSFTFFTQPKTKVIFKNRLLRDFVIGKPAVVRFLDLQKAIFKVGYTSYDLS